jgi:hypothetical protein
MSESDKAHRTVRPRETKLMSDIRMTIVEQNEEEEERDIRSTMVSHFFDPEEIPTSAPLVAEPQEKEGPDVPSRRFRPRFRPPLAVLKIVDDNQVSGEYMRLRTTRYIIGRETGDLVFTEEAQMSSRHAEILRCCENGEYSWYLNDLQSTNGSYLRIDFARLKPGDEVVIGSRPYLFLEDQPPAPRSARLIEMTGSGRGRELLLDRDEFLLGRDSVCPEIFRGDPLLSGRDARLYHSQDRWCLKATKSLNGLWFRVAQVKLVNGCWFQLGEQRFRIFFP